MIVGGSVAKQLTLQVWFGKGAVLSLKAVPGYDFVFKKEVLKKKRVGNFLSCMDEEKNAVFHIQLLITIQ